ncbi:MAG: hypothetical protein R3F24_11000 [Gammaproteobacteria bacterium]
MVYRYYHRLNPWQQRIYRRSDQINAIPVPAANELVEVTLAIGRALTLGEPQKSYWHAISYCAASVRDWVTPPGVTVLAERPAGKWGELHGLYNPAQGPDGMITVWMRTAKRSRVVAFRTFLRTLLHELCHHLDFVLLKLNHSFHTKGFYQRESSLYKQLLLPATPPGPVPG